MTVTSVMLVGVGGQGTILAADVLAKVAAAGDGASSRLKALLPNHISPKLFELARVIRFADAENPSSTSTPP